MGYRLDGQRRRFFDDHASPRQLRFILLQRHGHRIIRARETMIRNDRLHHLEPKMRNLRQHLAFARNPIRHHAIERAGGVKCDRCWRYTDDIGQNTAYPSVCARCSEALDAIDFPPYSAGTSN